MSRFKLEVLETSLCLDDRYSNQKPLQVNFEEADFLARVSRAGKKNELVAKAVGVRKGLRVLDCTAGLGRDGFLLAALGCEVTMLERSRVMYLLLKDGLGRAARHVELTNTSARIRLRHGDAKILIAELAADHDVLYLDPMFPEKKSSAAVKGDMQQMQRYLGSDQSAIQLLRHAQNSVCPKVVLKRPALYVDQEGLEPHHVVGNRNSRYEVFVAG